MRQTELDLVRSPFITSGQD